MKYKYNLALVPVSKEATITLLSQKMSDYADSYLLGMNSIPHVTVCQFMHDEMEVKALWEGVSKLLGSKTINLTFEDLSCISFDMDTFWASLLPKEADILKELHFQASSLIGEPINDKYDPHMTLINTKDGAHELRSVVIVSTSLPISDAFKLCLGRCDEVGQLTHIVNA